MEREKELMLLMISAQSHWLYFWALLLQSHPLLVRLISQFHTPTLVRPMVDFGKMEVTSKSCADNSECTRFSNPDKVLLSQSTSKVDSKQLRETVKPLTEQLPAKLQMEC